jgi:nicotinamidase-related amidase
MPPTALDAGSALVVIDLQNGIVALPTVPHAAADVVGRTARLATAFRAAGRPVVLVHLSHGADGGDVPPGRARSPIELPTPPGWDDIVDELAGHPEDIVVTKRNWGAFYGTDLDLHLRRRGITQVVVAGIATTVGVESTARAAHEHGYHVTIATDAVTDLDKDMHRHSVELVFPRLGETGTVDEIAAFLGSA